MSALVRSLAGSTVGDIVAGLICMVLFPYTVSIWIQIVRLAVAP